MENFPVKVWYDGTWETASDNNMIYVNGNVTALCINKSITFEEFKMELYELLQKNPSEYDMSVKTIMISSNHARSLDDYRPVEISNDKLMKVLLCMCMSSREMVQIFVTTSQKVPVQSAVIESVQRYESVQNNFCGPSTSTADDCFQDNDNYRREDDENDYFCYGDDDSNYYDDEDNNLSPVRLDDDTDEVRINVETAPPQPQRYRSRTPTGQFRSTGSTVNNEFQNPAVSVDPLRFSIPVMASDLPVADTFAAPSSGDKVFEGQLFKTKEDVYQALCRFAISNHFEFKVAKSASTRYVFICKTTSCHWRCRASRMSAADDVPWIVVRCDRVDTHTCINNVFKNGNRQARSSVVGHMITDKFASGKRIYTPNDIIDDIHDEHSIRMSYQQAYRSRVKALEYLRGTFEDSYNLLPQYSHVLKAVNHGTFTNIEISADNDFGYYFMAIGSCIRGFLQSIRPVIAVDGTHLKGKYLGTMFVATCLDGNNQLYPLAIGIVNSENDASWEWFMRQLHGVIGDVPDLAFISDRHKSIQKAVFRVFDRALHGICFYHVMGNLKSRYKMDAKAWYHFKISYITAAKSYSVTEFDMHMRGLWEMNPDAAKYLEEEVGVANWARCHFEGRRYSILTTNIAESVNALMREARKFPVTHMVEHFRNTLQQWFYDRKKVAVEMETTLTTYAHNIVAERKLLADRMRVLPVSEYQFQVLGSDRTDCVVNLQNKTCTCQIFQLDQLVCMHAIAVCSFLRIDHVQLCSRYYTRECLINAYCDPIIPVGDVNSWVIPEEMKQIKIKPPLGTPTAGRPKSLRIPSTGEDVVRNVRCSRCNQRGHNRKRCSNVINAAPNS